MTINTTDASFHFDTLTPDFMWYALAEIGIRAESGFIPLNSYENRVYQFIDEDKQRLVVKFYRPQRWSKEQILEEHNFALELQATDIAIAAPRVIAQSSLHFYQGYHFAVFNSVGGREFEIDNLDQLESVGYMMGRVHQVGKQSQFEHRPSIDLESYLYQPRQQLQNCSYIPSYHATSFFDALDTLIKQIEQQWFTPKEIIRLHGDCHPGNILWRDHALLVDLDDARMGPAIQDIWMLLHGSQQEQQLQLSTFIEAYEEYSHFDTQQLKLIEPLRGLRMVHYMAWLAKRWQDPAFPIAFPWFNDAQYWENQTKLLHEQTQALHQPVLGLAPQW